MKISVKNAIRNKGERFPVEGEVTFEPMNISGPIAFEKPVRFRGEITAIGDCIALQGEILAVLRLQCNLCNQEFTTNLSLYMDETFKVNPSPDDDAYAISHDEMIDISQPILGNILLNIPIERLCNANCKGLCPSCGVNRNEKSCLCSEQAQKDNPFLQLLNLMDDEEV